MKYTLKTIALLSILFVSTVALATDKSEATEEKPKKSGYFFILDPRTWCNADSNRTDDFCPLFLDY